MLGDENNGEVIKAALQVANVEKKNERIAPLEAVKDSGEGYEFERTERSEY